jgi:hypothetical protein
LLALLGAHHIFHVSGIRVKKDIIPNYADINPLNAELNPTCRLLALSGAHHIFHVSRIRTKISSTSETVNYIAPHKGYIYITLKISVLVAMCCQLGISNFFVVDRFVCRSNRTRAALLCIGKKKFLIYFGFSDY